MKSRPSSHLVILLAVTALTALSHYAVHHGALIRGYETSWMSGARNVGLVLILALLPPVFSFVFKFKGNWSIYTACVILFSIGLTVQYRLFSDPEYSLRGPDRAQARLDKTKTMQMHFVRQVYDEKKKALLGLPPTPPTPVDISEEVRRPVVEDADAVLKSGRTVAPLLAILGLILAFALMRYERFLELLRNKGFLIVLLTVGLLIFAAVFSTAGKFLGELTPWEPSKIPFLIGFAAVLAALYRNLARTYWGLPSGRDVVPLVFMAVLPFLPFFLLKDFGQMMVFSGVYITLFAIAVRRFAQRFVLIGGVVLIFTILVVGALPLNVQEKIPLLPTVARPVKGILPDRIQQRFHLWLDGFNPPSPETSWWKKDYEKYYADLVKRNPRLPALVEANPGLRKSINVDAWFDNLAFQPAQATFGLSAGGITGRGIGLGYVEGIPVADSDYIYAAIGEELGLVGGLLVTLALLILVSGGVRIAIDARDMFSKLCAAGLTAFLGFQALVNIGGITRALPMTGITLPFVSHGGFSLITSFVMLGMLMALSHRNSIDRKIAEDLRTGRIAIEDDEGEGKDAGE
jgi:cell division protein FtsW (lipid II flippase)